MRTASPCSERLTTTTQPTTETTMGGPTDTSAQPGNAGKHGGAEAAASRVVVHSAAALLIGSELLSGKTQDANLQALAGTLRSLGISLDRAVLVRDEVGVIEQEVRSLSAAHDLLITSGGVGPTHDDVTVDAVARALGRETQQAPELAALIERFHGARTTEVHLRMARTPVGARLLSSPEVLWPAITVDNVWLLPGVPEVFRMKLDILRQHVIGPSPLFSRAVYVNVEEADLQGRFDEVLGHHAGVEIGSYPTWLHQEYQTKVTFDGRVEHAVDAACAEFLGSLAPEQIHRVA